MRVAITASTGLIGTALTASLRDSGADVLRLVRRRTTSADELRWDPSAPDGGLSPVALAGIDAVVHLSGAPVGSRRWSAARKQILRDSRIASTAALVRALLAMNSPPQVLLAASAVGWYGDTGDRELDETAPSGSGFLAELVHDWEAATEPAANAGIRVVNLRTGLVISARGGLLKPLLLPFRLGLGARIGPGSQYLSWISGNDHVRACHFLLGSKLAGPVNLTAPAPATNAEFTAALARSLHRPALLRIPAAALRIGLGEMSGELLGSCRVRPARLQDAGFTFLHEDIDHAIAAALANDAAR